MIDRKLTGSGGTAGWWPTSSPEATLVGRPYLPIRTANDPVVRLDLDHRRSHDNLRSTI
jgi:hypothetical protein